MTTSTAATPWRKPGSRSNGWATGTAGREAGTMLSAFPPGSCAAGADSSWKSRSTPAPRRTACAPLYPKLPDLPEAAGDVILGGLFHGVAEDGVGVAKLDQLAGLAGTGDVEER